MKKSRSSDAINKPIGDVSVVFFHVKSVIDIWLTPGNETKTKAETSCCFLMPMHYYCIFCDYAVVFDLVITFNDLVTLLSTVRYELNTEFTLP